MKDTLENLEEKIKERTAELEKAYNSLMENERRLSEAQEMAHIGSWDWDTATGKMHWSDEMSRIFGLNPQKFGLPYDKVLNYIHPDDRDYVNNAIKAAFKGKTFDIDHRIISANGEERIVHAQSEIIFN